MLSGGFSSNSSTDSLTGRPVESPSCFESLAGSNPTTNLGPKSVLIAEESGERKERRKTWIVDTLQPPHWQMDISAKIVWVSYTYKNCVGACIYVCQYMCVISYNSRRLAIDMKIPSVIYKTESYSFSLMTYYARFPRKT